MKKSLWLLFFISVFGSCAVSPRHGYAGHMPNELESFQLILRPEGLQSEKNGSTKPSGLKLHSTFVFEPRGKTHPQIRVIFKDLPSGFDSPNLELFVELDGELIRLASKLAERKCQFKIAENIWVSFVYTQEISFILESTNNLIKIELNQTEKNKLARFFQKSIEQRDLIFPAIPEGKKKW